MPERWSGVMAGFKIFERMRADHARVLAELEALERERDDPARHEPALLRLVRMLERQFATHMSAEEEILFPALIEALPVVHDSLSPLRSEHDELRTMLAVLERVLSQPRSPAREEQLKVQARDLVDLLRIHVRKEETLVFSVAERVLPGPTLQRIAERLERPRPPAGGRSPDPTGEERKP